MCGRTRLSSDVSEIKLVFGIPAERPTPNFAPSWNVAPTDPLPIVRYDAKVHQRSLDVMRWGLVPFWAKDIKVGFANINAKAEGIESKPAFRDAFIFIAASPETVFRFFVEPAFMARWFGQQHTLDPRPGGIFRAEIGAGNVARGTYTEVIPHRRIAFTWGWEGRRDLPPSCSLVEIELMPQEGGTMLRLRHSGLPKTTEAPFTPEDHGKRWVNYLARLREQCAMSMEQARRTS